MSEPSEMKPNLRQNLYAAQMSVQLQKATQENYYRAVIVIFPLAPDQTIAQMWSNGARGGETKGYYTK